MVTILDQGIKRNFYALSKESHLIYLVWHELHPFVVWCKFQKWPSKWFALIWVRMYLSQKNLHEFGTICVFLKCEDYRQSEVCSWNFELFLRIVLIKTATRPYDISSKFEQEVCGDHMDCSLAYHVYLEYSCEHPYSVKLDFSDRM